MDSDQRTPRCPHCVDDVLYHDRVTVHAREKHGEASVCAVQVPDTSRVGRRFRGIPPTVAQVSQMREMVRSLPTTLEVDAGTAQGRALIESGAGG